MRYLQHFSDFVSLRLVQSGTAVGRDFRAINSCVKHMLDNVSGTTDIESDSRLGG